MMMSQLNTPVRRAGGGLDVYTALLLVSFLVLGAGVGLMAFRNMEHSGSGNQAGGVLKLVE